MKFHEILHRIHLYPRVALVAVLLVCLIAGGIWAARPLTRSVQRAALACGVLFGWTLIWWLVNSPLEGRTLVVFSATHGFTLGDTLGIPAVILGTTLVAIAWNRSLRRPRRPPLSAGGRPNTGPSVH